MSAFTVPAPSQPNYFVTAAKVAAATVGVLSAAGVSYALYFDYKRRNDPVFRKKLRTSSLYPLPGVPQSGEPRLTF